VRMSKERHKGCACRVLWGLRGGRLGTSCSFAYDRVECRAEFIDTALPRAPGADILRHT